MKRLFTQLSKHASTGVSVHFRARRRQTRFFGVVVRALFEQRLPRRGVNKTFESPPTHLTPPCRPARPGPPAELISNASSTMFSQHRAGAPGQPALQRSPTNSHVHLPANLPSFTCFAQHHLVRAAAVCEGGRRWPSAVCCWWHRPAPSCVQTVFSCVQTRHTKSSHSAPSPAPAAAETILSILLLTSCLPARMLSAETMMKGIIGNRKRL